MTQGLEPGHQTDGDRHEQDPHVTQQQAAPLLDPGEADELQGEQHEQQQHAEDAAGEGEGQQGRQGLACQQAGDDDQKITKVAQGALQQHGGLILATVSEVAV
ncbi:hypothetical protein D3C80_1939820 [compost metagenome]